MEKIERVLAGEQSGGCLNADARPAAEQKLFHRVGNLRQVLCSVMSGFRTQGANITHLGILSRGNSPRHPDKACKHDYVRIDQRQCSVPGLRGWQRCCSSAKRGSRARMSLTCGNRSSIISADPSAEALSATMISMLRRGGAPPNSLNEFQIMLGIPADDDQLRYP